MLWEHVICDEGDCTQDASYVLTCGTTYRRVCIDHRKAAVKDLKFLHPGERINTQFGFDVVYGSIATERHEAKGRDRAADPAPHFTGARQVQPRRRGRWGR